MLQCACRHEGIRRVRFSRSIHAKIYMGQNWHLLKGRTSNFTMESSFTAVTFNILARSLGSSVIPWVINVSEHARNIVRKSRVVNPEFDIKTWLRTTAEPEYKKHFHRNFVSGDKESMRSMWSARLGCQADVPGILAHVHCVEPDTLQYPGQRSHSERDDKLLCPVPMVTASNLRGLLRKDISDVADELFEELVKDEPIFKWENRGPRIFQIVTRDAISEFLPVESPQKLSDIVTLCEVQNPRHLHAFYLYIQ